MKKILTALLAVLGMNTHAEETIEPTLFIEQSFNGLKEVQSAHSQTWGLGSETTWSIDQDIGKISFTFPDKTAIADLQIIGTYSPQGTFMWAWKHPSIPSELSVDAQLVKAFGEKHNIKELTTHVVEISEDDAWKFTALAMRLGDTNGAYRADAGGGTLVYVTFGAITLSANKEALKK